MNDEEELELKDMQFYLTSVQGYWVPAALVVSDTTISGNSTVCSTSYIVGGE